MARRPRCAYCKKAFTPPRRGRPPKYCSDYHRVRAFHERHASAREFLSLALGKDIHDLQTKEGIERTVVEVLVKYGFLKPPPKHPPRIRIAVDNEREDTRR